MRTFSSYFKISDVLRTCGESKGKKVTTRNGSIIYVITSEVTVIIKRLLPELFLITQQRIMLLAGSFRSEIFMA